MLNPFGSQRDELVVFSICNNHLCHQNVPCGHTKYYEPIEEDPVEWDSEVMQYWRNAVQYAIAYSYISRDHAIVFLNTKVLNFLYAKL
jgi:hypothetical protein